MVSISKYAYIPLSTPILLGSLSNTSLVFFASTLGDSLLHVCCRIRSPWLDYYCAVNCTNYLASFVGTTSTCNIPTQMTHAANLVEKHLVRALVTNSLNFIIFLKCRIWDRLLLNFEQMIFLEATSTLRG
jgi:hypothetical protein